ncbi:MAG: hypothetical protein AB1631_11765 [Acidobacteriota bacterium]
MNRAEKDFGIAHPAMNRWASERGAGLSLSTFAKVIRLDRIEHAAG